MDKRKILNISNSFKAGIIIITLSVATLTGFQNCSKIQFADIAEQQRQAALEVARIGKDSEMVTAGLSEMPELKMVFVVDNSGTMKQNQLNLAQSFGAMFDESSSSLNRFNSTTYLINTAQTLPPYQNESERNSLFESINSEQNNFSASQHVPKSLFQSAYRTTELNSGKLPGDNLGFSLVKSSSPLSYELLPAPVLGVSDDSSGDVDFSPEIKMKANSDVSAVENEFKNRLAVMSADRVPQILQNNKYVPLHSSIVDTESGLCSIARILRNPAGFIEPGQFVSFTVVSDENDNDPAGTKCVQSVKELTGNEKLIDLDCKKNQTVISTQTPVPVTIPTQCKINGNAGYNYKISYSSTNPDYTNIDYAVLNSPAKYTAKFYNIKYKKISSKVYTYSHTKVVFYVDQCFDVYSDGNKIGNKCSPKTSPEPAQYKMGPLSAGQSCLALAKSYNSGALSSPAPVCTTEDRSVSSCDTSDPLCHAANIYADVTASGGPFAGPVPSAATCTSLAQNYSDYAMGASCESADKTGLSSCSGQPAQSACFLASAATYKYVNKKPSGNVVGADNCASWVKANTSNYQENASPFIKTCSYSASSVASNSYSGSINFVVNNSVLDGGNQIANNQPCDTVPAVADAIFSSAMSSNSNIKRTDSCIITGVKSAGEKTANLSLATCNDDAAKRCSDEGLRSCTAVTIAGGSTSSPGPLKIYKSVPERITCSSKCGDSVMGVCDAGTPADTLISDFLASKFGAGTVCTASTSAIDTGKKSLTAQLESEKDSVCKPNAADGAPTYPYVTRSSYYSQAKIIDYVSGTATDANGNSVPAMGLIDYIRTRIAELKSNQFVFSALIQKSSDPAPAIGSQGVEYEKLSSQITGKVDSVLSKDYSIALKDLSQIIKNSLERTFVLKKMRPDQRINQVTWIKNGDTSGGVIMPASTWTQNGNSIKVSDGVEFSEGDQFMVEFQNDVN
jgi:hypothetical protein